MEKIENISKDKAIQKVKALLDVVCFEKCFIIENKICHKVYRTIKYIIDCDVKCIRKSVRIDEHRREIIVIIVYKYIIKYIDHCGVKREVVKSEVVEEKISLHKHCEDGCGSKELHEENICLEIKEAYCKDLKFKNCGRHSIITGKVVIKAEVIVFEKELLTVFVEKHHDKHDKCDKKDFIDEEKKIDENKESL
ncbi:MAG TPA: hypothetical protein DCP90_07520 [Clostridiales bacterium]|nr:MAG: hypothetical protein A2Y22_04250 [Clostridiales bacterium GWD2_32_59]HAN10446.1 hypothetical protein [Clostridiales bacterium]